MTSTKDSPAIPGSGSGSSPYLTFTADSGQTFYITPLEERDIATNHETVSIPSVCNELISVPQPYTLENARSWVTLQMSPSRTTLPLQTIRADDPQTGRLIGSVALTPWPTPTSTEGEVGYYLHPNFRGLGIMRPAVEALLAWARAEMGMRTFFVRANEGNVGSRRIIEALKGFEEDKTAASWQEWPEIKGGGRKKLLVWRGR